MAATRDRKRTMYLIRATWLSESDYTLEEVMLEAHARCATTASRTFVYPGGKIACYYWEKRDEVTLGHVAYFVPRQPTSLVPEPSSEASATTQEYPPPEGTNFMEGDIIFLVKGDNVIHCPSGLRDSVLHSYLDQVLHAAEMKDTASQLLLEEAANLETLRVIRRDGVKSIDLTSSVGVASLDEINSEPLPEEKTVFGMLSGPVRSAVLNAMDLVHKDESLVDIDERENLRVKVSISFDGRRRAGELKRRVEALGQRIIEEDADDGGFTIKTGKDNSITSGETRVSQKVVIPARGNSVDRETAWSELRDYYQELAIGGILVQ